MVREDVLTATHWHASRLTFESTRASEEHQPDIWLILQLLDHALCRRSLLLCFRVKNMQSRRHVAV